MSRLSIGLVILFLLAAVPGALAAPAPAPRSWATATGVLVVSFNVQVDVGAAGYVDQAAQIAINNGYDVAVVMNTPGGLLDSMQGIVGSLQNVENHGLKVLTYVPPAGMAASAGSYIALESNAIYMGSGSFIGPSTPYVVGGDPSQEQHVQQAMIAYIVALARAHGFNADAAYNMAANNTAYGATDAASLGLINGTAASLTEALTDAGLGSLPLVDYPEPIYDQFLSFISNPLADGLFILVGMVALVLDLFHRTLFLTVVAVIMIALGFLGAQVIGAPIFAILILIIAAALIFIEVKAGHGMFAATGILLGLGGTYLLVYGVGWSPAPFGLGQYLVMGIVAAVMVVGFIYLAKIRRAVMLEPKLVDPTLVVNKTGRAMTDIVPGKDGVANVNAEDFTAVSKEPIEKGAAIRVVAYEDGKVHVEKVPTPGSAPTESGQATGGS